MATTPTAVPNNELPPVTPAAQPSQADPELARLRGEVARQREQMTDLQRKILASGQTSAQPNQPPDMASLNKQFYQNPVQNTADIARHVANELFQQNSAGAMDTLVQAAKTQARGSDPTKQKIFDKYAAEIETAAMSADPRFRANVNVWTNAFKFVMGEHLEEINKDFYGQQPEPEPARSPAIHIREGSGPAAPSARPSPAARPSELSDDEKRTARKLGITEDQYRAGKEHYNNQNGTGDPVGPSSWDKQFPGGLAPTPIFSTKELRRKQRAEAQQRRSA